MSGEGPPDKKEGAKLTGDAPEIETGTGCGFRFEDIDSTTGSQSPLQRFISPSNPYGRLWAAIFILGIIPRDKDDFPEAWQRRQVSERQREALLKFGIDLPREDLNLDQGTAGMLLDALIQRIQTPGLAYFPDVLWLYRHGVKNAGKLTSREARQLIEVVNDQLIEADAQRFGTEPN